MNKQQTIIAAILTGLVAFVLAMFLVKRHED